MYCGSEVNSVRMLFVFLLNDYVRGNQFSKVVIIPPKANSLNDAERLEIARLLIKAGYAVRIGKAKIGNSTVTVIEYWDEGSN